MARIVHVYIGNVDIVFEQEYAKVGKHGREVNGVCMYGICQILYLFVCCVTIVATV